jgi:hypothetical protein
MPTFYPDNSWIRWLVVLFMILLIILSFQPARASPIEVANLDWFAEESQQYINKETGAWATGTTVTVIDIDTGISFCAVRFRGTNHADFEPATQADTDALKSIYGEWSWERRAIIVIISDKAFAASMNGMPHGKSSVKDNGFPGHACIHFLNSKTHGSRRVDKAHQAAVMEAYSTDVVRLNILLQKGEAK